MGIITVDEEALERFVRRVMRSEMAAGIKFVPSAASDLEDLDDDRGAARVVHRGKKKRSAKKKASFQRKASKKRARKLSVDAEASREATHALLMARGPLRVTQIVDITGIAQSTVNKHLNNLMKMKRVSRLQQGTKVLYKAVHDGRLGRKTAPKGNGKKAEKFNAKESVVPPASGTKPVAA
jgi:DNA-binding transcriptional ArsR family regulator